MGRFPDMHQSSGVGQRLDEKESEEAAEGEGDRGVGALAASGRKEGGKAGSGV